MTAWELAAAVALDLILGDPRALPHPVKAIGGVIVKAEGAVRNMARTVQAQRLAGVCLAIGLPAGCLLGGWLLIALTARLHPVAGMVTTVYLAYTTLAIRDLIDHARAVHRALEDKDLEAARSAVSRIVGRDTARLPEPEVVRATVETVAESASDGIIAPLCYLVLGGPPLALAYKAISTLDSMVGHDTEAHRDLGWASARLDDAANWIPARLTGLLLVGAAFLRRYDGRTAWRIFRRDAARHPSPNSGRPESAMAGALRVQLGGMNFYAGIGSDRPRLGDPLCPLVPGHITMALDLILTATGIAIGIALIVLAR